MVVTNPSWSPVPLTICPRRLRLTQALSDVLDVLELYCTVDVSSSCSTAVTWWTAACSDAGRLLLQLAATAVSPTAAGGSSSSSGGGSCSAVLLLMWRLGGVMCPGLWGSEVITLGWLLMCVSAQQVRLVCCGLEVKHHELVV
jgi:hypothetical protein